MPEPVPGRTESPVPFLAQARQARARQSDQQAVARNQEAESERNVLQNRDIRSARSRENIVADRDRIRNAGAAQAEADQAARVPPVRRQAAPSERGNFIDLLA